MLIRVGCTTASPHMMARTIGARPDWKSATLDPPSIRQHRQPACSLRRSVSYQGNAHGGCGPYVREKGNMRWRDGIEAVPAGPLAGPGLRLECLTFRAAFQPNFNHLDGVCYDNAAASG